MDRIDFIKKKFKYYFESYKNCNIAIYGAGKVTKLLIDQFREFNFIGVIDRLEIEGTYCGLPKLSYEDILNKKTDLIIIATAAKNVELVRKRIGKFCIVNNILLCSADGEILNLDDCVLELDYHPSHSLSRDEVQKLLFASSKIILEAGGLIVKKGEKIEFRKEFSDDILRAACLKKKIIILFENSNDNLRTEFKKNLKEHLNSIYLQQISNEGVYRYLDRQSDKTSIIFIGMKYVKLAEMCGIKALHLYNPETMLKYSSYADLEETEKFSLSELYKNAICNNIFNSPYALSNNRGMVVLNNSYDIGYVLLGPLVVDFLFWMIQKIRKRQYDHVIFVARDGFLFRKIYDKVQKRLGYLPLSTYLYASRIVCSLATMKTKSDIKKAWEDWKGNIESFLIQQCGLDWHIVLQKEPKISDEEFICNISGEILKSAESIRTNYIMYIQKNLPESVNRFAFMDFFASGSCQLGLTKLSLHTYEGLYMCKMYTKDKEKNSLIIDSFLEDSSFWVDHSILMETIFTAFEPTVTGFDNAGNPILGKETRSEEELAYVSEVQKGIEDFADDILNNIYSIPEPTNGYSKKILKKIVSKYTLLKNNVIENYVLEDEAKGTRYYIGNFYKF